MFNKQVFYLASIFLTDSSVLAIDLAFNSLFFLVNSKIFLASLTCLLRKFSEAFISF